MKKQLRLVSILGLFLVALLALGVQAVPVGQINIGNYVYRWPFPVPEVTVTTKLCQINCDSQPLSINVSGMQCGQRAWLYVIVEDDQLIEIRGPIGNGLYQVLPPSRVYNRDWKVGPQHYVVILSTTPRFQFANGWHPTTITAESWLGYPSSGYVVVRDGFFNVYPSQDCGYWRCCCCHCP